MYFDEISESKRKQQAERVLKNAKWLIDGYLKDGKVITERQNVIIEMVKQGLAIGECKSCDFSSSDFQQIIPHNKKPGHQIGFREI
jgi:hypothetical protein